MLIRNWARSLWDRSFTFTIAALILAPAIPAFTTDGGDDGGGANNNGAPPSLKTVAAPMPGNLAEAITDMSAALRMGKALFWDMQVGSNGVTACASCHFHAGADFRSKNQIGPGAGDVFNETFTGGNGPNYQLKAGDFPLHRQAVPDDNQSAVIFDTDDRIGSQGVFNTLFTAVNPGNAVDSGVVQPDPNGFIIGGTNVHRVTGRNTPTNINAIFLHRIFHDGRANNTFNGANPFGDTDPNAMMLVKQTDGSVIPVRELFDHAATASQAVGPPGNGTEMSHAGRNFSDIGRKMCSLTPLAGQLVAADDSVLGTMSAFPNPGLLPGDMTYRDMIEQAFNANLWDSTVDFGGFDQMEMNFSMFFGLSVLVFESTLVSDDSPFDQFQDGGGASGTNSSALTAQQQEGLDIFLNRGRCIECHAGPEFAGGTVAQVNALGVIQRAEMSSGGSALVDTGFRNIGVRPTAEDIGNAGIGPFGTFSLALRAQQGLFDGGGINPPVSPTERNAVEGSFKIPSLRNVELTGPFGHNGGFSTLEQIVDFYTGGAHFAAANQANLAKRVDGIGGMDPDRKAALVSFLKALTDERVRTQSAPFDHPQLFVFDGHPGDENAVTDDGTGNATNAVVEIPAVGAGGGPALDCFDHLLMASATALPLTGLQCSENGLVVATPNIRLDMAPTQNVRINLTSSDTMEGTVTPTSLTFTPQNWSTPQTLTVHGVEDMHVDGNVQFQIVTSAAISTDVHFSGMNVPNITVTSVDSGRHWDFINVEAEAGTLTSPMVNQVNASASGGHCVVTPNGSGNQLNSGLNSGMVTFTFTAPTAGTYVIWGREDAATAQDDSFWVRMDLGAWTNWTLWGRPDVSWVWDLVNNSGTQDPIRYTLTAGSHTLRIKNREDGARLDKIVITNDLSFVPTGAPVEQRVHQGSGLGLGQ